MLALFKEVNLVDEALLELDSVSKIFTAGLLGGTRIKAVDNVSMKVYKGEILGILGESGSGKSTIAKLILKILKPTSGKILYRGRDVWSIDNKVYYRRVQGVFQDPYASFNPRRRVLDIFVDTMRNYYAELTSKITEELERALSKVGMNVKDVIGKYSHEFSGGQLQRLSIARALLVKPEAIVADEPVSMVDASTRIDILNIFIDLKEEEGLASIIIGHDLGLASYVSDRVVVLYKGQVVEQGTVNILRDPAHPYTKMLLEAVPRIDYKWTTPLRYQVESVQTRHTTGCVFVNRCPFRLEDKCAKLEPHVVNLGDSQVKCWLYAEK
ncbi:MAG: ABC transporter ATP-binding protein [Desulfurococcaceae archaeon]